jgi:hypothetical protein
VIKPDEMARIINEMDYIHSPKYGNSLKRFMDHYPDGAPDSVICKALGITQQQLDDIYKTGILKLKEGMGV